MRAFALAVALVLATVALDATRAAPVTVTLEHSFDGKAFTQIGSVEIPQTGGTPVKLPGYPEALSAAASQLRTAAGTPSGRYFMRLVPSSAGGEPLLASVPARCWASAGADAGITLHALDGSGAPVGLSLTAPCPDPTAAAPTEALPHVTFVQVARPLPAPTVTLPVAGAGAGAAQQMAAQQAGQAGQQGKQGGVAPGGKGGPPPKDERTFFQKNWMPIMLVGFMISNRLGQMAQPPQGGGPPGRALPAGAPRPGAAGSR